MRLCARLAQTLLAFAAMVAVAAPASASVSMEFVGRANSGDGLGGAEIAAYDPATKRIYVTNGATRKIDIFSVANPAAPTKVRSVTLTGAGDIQSVATNGSIVAVAAITDATDGKYLPGRVYVMDMEGTLDRRAPTGVVVGALPDSVHFTPDGTRIVTANEGEPKDYCQVGGDFVDASDPRGSISIIDVTGAGLSATTLEFTAFNSRAADIRAAGGRIYGPGADVDQDLEPEYVAISADSRTAFVTLQENNAVAEIDLQAKSITRIMGLGYKDHSVAGNGLDASNEDSATDANSGNPAISIRTWPMFGMYQPDAIATFSGADGTRYFVTANEGDARSYPCLLGGTTTSKQDEDGRTLRDLTVSGTAFGTAPWTKAHLEFDSNLGKIDAITRFFPATATTTATYGGSTFAGALNGNGNGSELTSVYALGARSISVFRTPSATGVGSAVLVGDTGDAIEQAIASELPAVRFNTSWQDDSGSGSFGLVRLQDQRSPKKGPEPEGLAVGRAFGKTIAFVGLERVGGVMAFDLANPAAPAYLDYLNTSDFAANFNTGKATAAAGDAGPEGVWFVRATDSPTGTPALIVSHEYSGTTAIYKVVGTAVAPQAPTEVAGSASKRSVEVSWRSPADDGGAPITQYLVTAEPGGATCASTDGLKTSCTVRGLDPGTEYTFSVTAANAKGASAASAKSAKVATGTAKPERPRRVRVVMGQRTARVSWRAPRSIGGTAITGYTATAEPGGPSCTTKGTSCTIRGLAPGRLVAIAVTATNAEGTSLGARPAEHAVRVGATPRLTDVAPGSRTSLRWLVLTESTGRITGTIASGSCTIANGRLVAPTAIGSECAIDLRIGRRGGFSAMRVSPTVRVADLTARGIAADLRARGRATG
jgi:hypothetical protein